VQQYEEGVRAPFVWKLVLKPCVIGARRFERVVLSSTVESWMTKISEERY